MLEIADIAACHGRVSLMWNAYIIDDAFCSQ